MSSNKAVKIITPTVIGTQIQTERALGLQHNVLDFTTINHALSLRQIVPHLPDPLIRGMEVLPEYNFVSDSSEIFTQCLIIGNGAHKNVTGSSTSNTNIGFNNNPSTNRIDVAIPYTVPVPHRATDTGLYNMIPFLVRPVTDDLSIAERRRFCLRRTMLIDNILYAAYYGRFLEISKTTASIVITEIVDGVETQVEYVPTYNNLHPTHPTEDTSFDGSYGVVTAPIEVIFDEDDIQELRDACRLLYNNENYAIISELGICSGVKKPIEQKYPNSGTGSPINVPANTFFETVACQVNTFISTHVSFVGVDKEYTMQLDLGNTEPVFGTRT